MAAAHIRNWLISEIEILKRELEHVHTSSRTVIPPEIILQCAQNGNAKEVARIIKADPTRLHARNPQGQMPLHVAATKGHVDVVDIIINAKAGECTAVVLVKRNDWLFFLYRMLLRKSVPLGENSED